MTAATLYGLASALLFALAFRALVVKPHLVKKVLALNIMGSSVSLFLVSVAKRAPGEAPDPVPHAMVLTGIVVALAATALALALARRIYRLTGHTRLPEAQ